MPNARLLAEFVNDILDDPPCWNQSTWHCGTAHCVFGHAQIRSGKDASSESAYEDGTAALELTEGDARWLSSPRRSLTEIHGFADALLQGEQYFSSAGYDRAGYDRAGERLPQLIIPDG